MNPQLKVYLVEDSPVIRERVVESLEESHSAKIVGAADSEEEAVSGILNAKPDAVVLDIQLREGNGLNVLRRLRECYLEVRPLVIILTNYTSPECRSRAVAAGGDYFFDKVSEFYRVTEILDELADDVGIDGGVGIVPASDPPLRS
jgi:DNA-binding NarL/FixJ family response regulator